jgi:hypothetical protein
MNREDIIKMAHDAGMTPISHVSTSDVICNRGSLERFAALVAAAEREECAKVCDELHAGLRKTTMKQHQDYLDGNRRGISECAFAIRARRSDAKS